MQHGTGRELAIDLIENAEAISTQREVRTALNEARRILEEAHDLDERGVYGPDYGFDRVVKYLGPTGSIRDSRPKDLGR